MKYLVWRTNIIKLFIALFLFSSCEEVIRLDLEEAAPRLVIDAQVARYYVNGSATPQNSVRVILSTSTGFYNTQPYYVNDAEVKITSQNTDTTYDLALTASQRGVYELLSDVDDFEILDNSRFLLEVTYNGETYSSSESLNPSVPIVGLEQVANSNLFDPDQIKLKVTYQDLVDQENFYIFRFGDSEFIPVEDRFVKEDTPFTFDYFLDDAPVAGEDLNFTIALWGSDLFFNNYLNSILTINGEGRGSSPFDTQPFSVKGNIYNTTTSDRYPYGYFRVHDVYTQDITLVPNSEF